MKKTIAFLFLVTSASALAHCPTPFKPENVCLMLDQNVIFVYDHKLEHDGPYKDFKESSIATVKVKGTPVKFSRVARGVYRIESAQVLNAIEIEMINGKKKATLKLSKD